MISSVETAHTEFQVRLAVRREDEGVAVSDVAYKAQVKKTRTFIP